MEIDDPKRPWKAIGAVITAEATFLLGQQLLELPVWVIIVLNMVLVGGATFGISNPKVTANE